MRIMCHNARQEIQNARLIKIQNFKCYSKERETKDFFKKFDEILKESISTRDSLSSKSNNAKYQDDVIKLLHETKERSPLTKEDYVNLQCKIEDFAI
jgi:hypothetical protein